MDTKLIRTKLNKLLMEKIHLERKVSEEKESLDRGLIHVSNVEASQKLVQDVAEKVQSECHRQISNTVSRCLRTIFGKEAYEFRIEFSKKRGKTEANLVFERGGVVLEDPVNSGGGGQVDVAALALRLSCLMLSQPKIRKLLVLDEPLKFLSVCYQESVADFLMHLSREMGIQFVIVTHSELMRVGKIINLDVDKTYRSPI